MSSNPFMQYLVDEIRSSDVEEYQIYLAFADDGKGGDITRPGQPLKTFDEWLGI